MTATQMHPIAALGFSLAAEAYTKARPEYPLEFMQMLLQGLGLNEASEVLEIAAGTGKFTRALSALIPSKITVVEPLKAMRQQFQTILPEIELLEGTAEKIPAASRQFDAVFVAQAFHWFSWPEAIQEFHRVLKPEGFLGLVFYEYDDTPEKRSTREWLVELCNLFKPYVLTVPRYRQQKLVEFFKQQTLFSDLEFFSYPYAIDITAGLLLEKITTYSFIASLPEPEKGKILETTRGILAKYSETESTLLSMPYRMDGFKCQRKEAVKGV